MAGLSVFVSVFIIRNRCAIKDFQSLALPTELSGLTLNWRIIESGLEPVKLYFKKLKNSCGAQMVPILCPSILKK